MNDSIKSYDDNNDFDILDMGMLSDNSFSQKTRRPRTSSPFVQRDDNNRHFDISNDGDHTIGSIMSSIDRFEKTRKNNSLYGIKKISTLEEEYSIRLKQNSDKDTFLDIINEIKGYCNSFRDFYVDYGDKSKLDLYKQYIGFYDKISQKYIEKGSNYDEKNNRVDDCSGILNETHLEYKEDEKDSRRTDINLIIDERTKILQNRRQIMSSLWIRQDLQRPLNMDDYKELAVKGIPDKSKAFADIKAAKSEQEKEQPSNEDIIK